MPDTFLALTFKFKSATLKAVKAAGIDIVPMEIQTLHVIHRRDNCTAAYISEQLERDKGQIARLVREMTEKGYIHTVPNPEDTRSKFIKLTEFGQQTLSRMLVIENDIIQRMQLSLTTEQIEMFNEVALAMTQNLSQQ
ncbi:helix-turn-helix domain-containing protein [Aliiglaciecola sp. CAU 1673]|uniref:MarR family winged helix-turn-helix transcriptional regulator n=1 Tax=Aliiglaciecola sp. CAU 1673 TaxID=3032595 RepID=UPI0023DA6D4A|nr:helix-turn-helix domain-containing protein [Aliiglaciecola sp. CAU 1673]